MTPLPGWCVSTENAAWLAASASKPARPGLWRCIFSYQPRTYRHWVRSADLVTYEVVVRETDLYISTATDLSALAHELVQKYRAQLEGYIQRHPSFLHSFEPLEVASDAPPIVKEMAQAAKMARVGPMAAVAGAVAEFVGRGLEAFSPEVIIENGGDIYLKSLRKRVVGVYAGKSPLSGKLGLEIPAEDTPLGICTSSGTVSHSFSYGKADAVTVLALSASLADAAATAVGNAVVTAEDIPRGIKLARSIKGLSGVVIIKDERVGFWGRVNICPL
ncbi:MAG: UPF0280 family protein [Chloroflexota bacterium]